MSTLAENVLAAGAENIPPMLEKGGYDTWKRHMPFKFKEITIVANEATRRPAETRMQTWKDLTLEEKIRKECDIRVANIILHGLPNDIYTLLNHKKKAYNIWINMTKLQVNTKFVNHLLPKWSRFVTGVKQAMNLHEVSSDQLYAYLKQNEPDANEFHAMKARFSYLLTLITNTYNPPPSYSSYKSRYKLPVPIVAKKQPYIPQPSYEPHVVYQQPHVGPTSPDSRFVVTNFLPMDDSIASLNKATMFLTIVISSRYPPTNNQLRTSSNPRTQANIKYGRVVVQNIQGRQSQSYTGIAGRGRGTGTQGVQQRRGLRTLSDGMEGFDSDCEDLQLNATSILMTKKVDAYDSEVDDAPTASAIFMAKLLPTGSINGDKVGPSYDTYILSEVPNYDTYHANDMFNPFVQELPDSEQLVFVNETCVDFLSKNNVLSDNPYPDNNEDEVVQDMTSLAQNDVAILLLIENMQHEVTRCNTVNLESKQVNETLTIELDRYREKVNFWKIKRKIKLFSHQLKRI
ncbi:hypothetical protein Tco_1070552 [Tanacetum coccineum]|uniref:Uncharacterized protein n=1 Tax=Tanacetum coccineum TaxID=301880 RepID=A0ABQ5HLQ7_9ASTR